jgi:hypothetical protein
MIMTMIILYTTTCCRLNIIQTTTALTTTTTTTTTLAIPTTTNVVPFSNFCFAPNGVCISPKYFVTELQEEPNNDSNNTAANAAHSSNSMSNDNQQLLYDKYFTMRNVPGDGDCMFLAVALAAATSTGLGMSNKMLNNLSRETREIVAQVLSAPSGKLFIGPDINNIVDASQLLQSAVSQEPTINTTEDYLIALRKEGRDGGLYGGGPELAVLSNVLRRPISIYEVDENSLQQQQQRSNNDECYKNDRSSSNSSSNDEVSSSSSSSSPSDEFCFPITCKGSFGEGVFDDPCLTSIPDSAVISNIQPGAYSWRLHILVLDVSPTERHACVLLPQRIYK